jgi:hypothetical protein
MLGVLVTSTASAGYIEAVYDLNGSSMTTTTLLGTFPDPISGQVTMLYFSPSASAPLTGVKLGGGNTHVTIGQTGTAIAMTLTGTLDTLLLPEPGGTPGTLSGGTINLAPVANSWVTGFMHCFGGLCGLAGFTASVPAPQTPTTPGPFPWVMPPMVFGSGTAGVGNFAATLTSVVTSPTNVTVVFNYVGQEISRSEWAVPEPGTFSLFALGLAGLAGVRSLGRWRTR